MTYAPYLEVLHYALHRDLVQQDEVADADIVVARHPYYVHSPVCLHARNARDWNCRHCRTSLPSRATTAARDGSMRTDDG